MRFWGGALTSTAKPAALASPGPAGGGGDAGEGGPTSALQRQLDAERAAEEELDSQLGAVWGAMRRMTDHALNRARLYVTDADVMALPPMAASDQVVAVLAPQGTTLEVPEGHTAGAGPDKRRYRCAAARGSRGPVELLR
jgi:transcription factor E2F3